MHFPRRVKLRDTATAMDRRSFLTRTSHAGLAAAIGATLPASAFAATPRKGGRLIVGVTDASTTDTLDPAKSATFLPQFLTFQIRNCLVEIDAAAQPIPELAESWEAADGAKRWVFQLRKGIEFHSGKTLDAEDVVYSINHHRGEKTESAAKSMLEPVANIKADGKHTVVFTLESPNADFPVLMSSRQLVIVPKGADFTDGDGTGGYILQEFEPGIRAFTTRNPNYWKEGRAHFDEVETLGINDAAARTSALRQGKIHAMNRPDLKTFDLLAKIPNFQTIEAEGAGHYTMPMRCDMAPYNDNDVRLALKLAIDREKIVETILRGHGTVGNDQPINSVYRFHADLPQRTYDPDQAKFHLKKAGQEGLKVTLYAADAAFAGAVDTAVLFSEHAKEAGIEVVVERVPNDGYWSNVWMKQPFCFSYWWGRATADWMFSTTYAAGADWNEAFWEHERFNTLLKEARAVLDPAKRQEMYTEMQRIVRDEGGSIIPVFNNELLVATDQLAYDGTFATNYPMDGMRLPERWWFKA